MSFLSHQNIVKWFKSDSEKALCKYTIAETNKLLAGNHWEGVPVEKTAKFAQPRPGGEIGRHASLRG